MTQSDNHYRPTPEEPYMNPRQTAFFRAKLVAWRKRLNAENRLFRQRILENEYAGGDLLDQSVNDSNRAMNFLSRNRQQQLIMQIDAALNRLDNGSYGYCLESDEEIGIQRLLAYPIATLSVETQEQLEKQCSKHRAA